MDLATCFTPPHPSPIHCVSCPSTPHRNGAEREGIKEKRAHREESMQPQESQLSQSLPKSQIIIIIKIMTTTLVRGYHRDTITILGI